MGDVHWHPALAVLLAALVLGACQTVPYTARSQLQLLSPQQESQMGVEAYQQILGKAKPAAEGASSEMVARVGRRSAAVSGTRAALSGGNLATVQAVGSLLRAGASVGVLLPWSRKPESEADHLRLILMTKAGYDPHAARDLWVRMGEAKIPGMPQAHAV